MPVFGLGSRMRRRKFISIFGGAAATWPFAARAQQTSGPRKVGVLFPGVLGADRERLINEGLANELGNQKAVLLARSSAGDDQLLGKYAAELAATVDVILAIASGSLLAARQASQSIPIVALDLEADPIAIGAAQSLNRPGGNVTGFFSMRRELRANGSRSSGKRSPRQSWSHSSMIRIWTRHS